MIYLDTHVVVWLYQGLVEKLSPYVLEKINSDSSLVISPLVKLELGYLHEIKRLVVTPDVVLSDLASRIELQERNVDLNLLCQEALQLNFTRDPFDRLIASQVQLDKAELLTKDKFLLENLSFANW